MANQDSKELDALVPQSANSEQRSPAVLGSAPPVIQVGADRHGTPRTPSPGSSPRHNAPLQRSISEKGSREHVALLPPEITYDTVTTAPNSPTDPGLMGGSAFAGFNRATTHGMMESRSTSVTPSGSLLCVSKPIELRESTLTINYPDTGGE